MASNPTLRAFVVDAGERVLFTFVETLLALYAPVVLSVTTGGGWHQLLDLSFAQKGVVAGVAAVLVVLKSVVAQFVGDVNTPGFVPNWVRRLFGLVEKAPTNTV